MAPRSRQSLSLRFQLRRWQRLQACAASCFSLDLRREELPVLTVWTTKWLRGNPLLLFIYVFPFSAFRPLWVWRFQQFVCLVFWWDCFGEAAGDLAAASCFLSPAHLLSWVFNRRASSHLTPTCPVWSIFLGVIFHLFFCLKLLPSAVHRLSFPLLASSFIVSAYFWPLFWRHSTNVAQLCILK